MARIPMVVAILALSTASPRADLVECENGDRYHGKVLRVDEREVKLQNEVTGLLTIPRVKVSVITFGNPKPAKAAAASAKTNAPNASATTPSTTLIEQVQNQFLSEATPEATQMYQEMVRDFLSGKLSQTDLRAKAQSTLQELDDLKRDLGDDDAAALLGSYASILQNFLKGSAGPATTPTNPPPKSSPVPEN